MAFTISIVYYCQVLFKCSVPHSNSYNSSLALSLFLLFQVPALLSLWHPELAAASLRSILSSEEAFQLRWVPKSINLCRIKSISSKQLSLSWCLHALSCSLCLHHYLINLIGVVWSSTLGSLHCFGKNKSKHSTKKLSTYFVSEPLILKITCSQCSHKNRAYEIIQRFWKQQIQWEDRIATVLALPRLTVVSVCVGLWVYALYGQKYWDTS